MTKLTKVAATIAALAASAGFSTAAHANCSPGFFADALCQFGVIDEETANTLDAANAAMGQPFDNAVYAAADTILPGAGTAAGTYAGMQQRGSRGGRGAPAPAGYPSTPMAQPNYPSAPMGYGSQYYQPPQVNYVYNCYTPQGVFNFGQPLIAGTQCFSMTAYGTFYGTAGR